MAIVSKVLFFPLLVWRWGLSFLFRMGQNILTALIQIWANKGRSILTTLGIIIAVSSIITVVAFMEGFGNYLTGMLRGYGTQYMIVRPNWRMLYRGHGTVTLDMADINAVRGECKNIQRISPFVYAQGELTYGEEKAKDIPIRGVSEQYQVIRNFHAEHGRFFGPIDIDNGTHVIVLGRTLLKMLRCNESIVGDYVQLNDTRFQVIGILESKGSFLGDDQDQTVMIPYTTAIRMFPGQRRLIPFLAEADSEDNIPQAHAQVTRVLRQRHNIEPGQPNDFYVERQDQVLKEFDNVKTAASSILAGIVSISLLVGGIGIMNIMLVSVTERTHEIGLRKSVGGRRHDILFQFLTEAVVLCTIGGLIGIALGYAVSYIGSLHPEMVETKVPWWSVVLALGFSAGTGIVFGIIPAFKAAILHPIDALRHE